MAIIPIYNRIVVPGANVYFKTDNFKKITGKLPRENEKLTLIVAKDEKGRQEPKNDSFYPIGINGIITDVSSEGYFTAHMENRVDILELEVHPDGNMELTVARRRDIDDMDHAEEISRINAVKEEMVRFSEQYQWGAMIRAYAAHWQNIGDIASAFAPWMINTNEERYALLEEDSKKRRFEMTEKMIYENLEMAKVNQRATTAQEEEYQKLYRENAIKKQMEYLQKELDDMHPENVSDIRRLEIRLQESKMNEEAKKEGTRLLNRLKSEGANSAENGSITDYLELLTSLPWEKEPAEKIDLDQAGHILDADHFGLDKVKKRIIQQLAVVNLKGRQTGSILLFVGAPGTGKTSIGQNIAKAMGREYVRISLGGVRDEADIRGHRRTYIGSMPGRIIDGIRKCRTSNPVIVLDEVDKLSHSYNGDPASALLEVLDPEQNAHFTDHYLNVPFDLSDVFFICTANTVDTIPEPLLNRMEMISFRGYTPIEKLHIAREHLLPKSMAAIGIPQGKLSVSDKALDTVISDYTREAGVRGLKNRIDMICRNAAVSFVKDADADIKVDESNLRDYMDTNPITQKHVPKEAKPGIVTGLAWTSVGGAILYIETMLTKGSGKVIITGQLGDVMKESAQIAISLVKSRYPDKAQLFEENDLHIHVPDGATPKDGPSAGITLTTALSSLVTGHAVSPSVAMTGEVSLQGRVNPIGGLPEKLMAAQRAGVKKVFIPIDNEADLRDVAAEVKEALFIQPVKWVSDVLEALDIPANQTNQ